MQSFIGLGGNLGAVADTFRSALHSLDSFPTIQVGRVSSHFLTPPMGSSAGSPFLNAAAELETDLPPLELLDALQSVESQHHRRRLTRWGPRTLDLDLLLFGETVLNHPRLELPHPGCWYRRFVLDPLAEIAPDVLHPVKGVPIQELRDRLLVRPLNVGIVGGRCEEREHLTAELSKQFADAHIKPWSPDTEPDPTLLLWTGPSPEETIGFEDLPLLPRLNLSRFPEDARAAARHVLSAALGS